MNRNDRRNELFTHAMSHLANENLGMSIDLLNEILETDPEDKLALMARGSVYLKRGKVNRSISDFTRVINNDENYAKAYHLRGLAREMAGDDGEALNDFNKAVDIDATYGAAYYSRATLHTKMGNEDSAVEDMKTISQLTNQNIEEYANENNVWRSQHLHLESITDNEMNR